MTLTLINIMSLPTPNSGHTATIRSAKMHGFASHFVCTSPLNEMPLLKRRDYVISVDC